MSKKAILTIIPLVALLFITTYNNSAFAEEIGLECQAGEVVVIRTTNPNPICVDEDTANKWVQYKIATIVVASSDEVEVPEDAMDEAPMEVMDEAPMDEAPMEVMDEGTGMGLECQAREVVVIRTTNPDPTCVDEVTANKWVQYKMATIVADSSSDEVEEVPEDAMDEQ